MGTLNSESMVTKMTKKQKKKTKQMRPYAGETNWCDFSKYVSNKQGWNLGAQGKTFKTIMF